MKRLILVASLFTCITLNAQTFTLKSNELGGQATEKQVFNGFGCKGKNVSPQLSWENPPAGTKSYAITIYDENAPTGSGWWHWLIFDIDSNYSSLKSGVGDISVRTAPAGSIQSKTDFGSPGYGGPCPVPGSGFHKYTITIYALDTKKLGLNADSAPPLVGFSLSQHVIEKASLIFYYKQ